VNDLRSRTASHPDGGFTLVEIVIAIVLVGVLSAVVVVGVASLTGKGESAACAASSDAATAAAVSYYAVHRTYPVAFQEMVDGGELTLADDVTVAGPSVLEGSGWTLTMVSVDPGTKPGFTCS
jgi:prepilin-type N-terminal cleavage/methylation domain-containing protein